MTDQEINRAVAELDEWSPIDLPSDNEPLVEVTYIHPDFPPIPFDSLPHYTTSHDAIIPVIVKQPMAIKEKISKAIGCKHDYCAWIEATPKHLCEELVRVTGKWIE